MSDRALLETWVREFERPVGGWDFSAVADRMTVDSPPWDFEGEVRTRLLESRHVLDMGTGGGEWLQQFAGLLPRDTVATEGWPPNVPVARRALEPLGVQVVAHDPEATFSSGRRMPFPEKRFDLILNRHEAFDLVEIRRVLSPGGIFVTQQVSGDDVPELHDLFCTAPAYPANLLQVSEQQACDLGLRVLARGEWSGSCRFHSVASLVGYLRLVPWDAPDDFSVDRYAAPLLKLHHASCGDGVVVTMRRFWMRIAAPAGAEGA
jgi:SAM-dependent methyltransferase